MRVFGGVENLRPQGKKSAVRITEVANAFFDGSEQKAAWFEDAFDLRQREGQIIPGGHRRRVSAEDDIVKLINYR
jgi:hypothetical protein